VGGSGWAGPVHAARGAARPAGTVREVGMVPNEPRGVNLAPMISKELDVRGSLRFNTEIDQAITLLAEHPELEQVITHTFPAEDAVAAFSAGNDSQASGKVLVGFGRD